MIADRYELLGRIGRGATGSVYRAFDRTLDRDVAIKLLQPGQLEVAEHEAQVLARVTHRNVVTIHDFGHGFEETGGQRYLVLELLDGPDFRAWLRGRPESSQIVEHFIEAGRGLSAAHQAGLVHRDFKPSNVILTNEGRVVVIDFGLACSLESRDESRDDSRDSLDSRDDSPDSLDSRDLVSSSHGRQRFAEGTLAYMAPERLAGHHNDERSDQFSFCVALWEALAGTNPFAGDDPLARYRAIRRGPPDLERKFGAGGSGVAKHVIASLERGMAFDRMRRFSSMDELLGELKRPAARYRDRRGRPVLMTIAVAATFLIGWGVTPENANIKEAQSSLDPTTAAALALLDSAQVSASEGDSKQAVVNLQLAAELIEAITLVHGQANEKFCAFATAVPQLGHALLDQGAASEARFCYAMAIRYSEKELCDGLDENELRIHYESARGTMWAKGQRKTKLP